MKTKIETPNAGPIMGVGLIALTSFLAVTFPGEFFIFLGSMFVLYSVKMKQES